MLISILQRQNEMRPTTCFLAMLKVFQSNLERCVAAIIDQIIETNPRRSQI